jgi:hypothetical protein
MVWVLPTVHENTLYPAAACTKPAACTTIAYTIEHGVILVLDLDLTDQDTLDSGEPDVFRGVWCCREALSLRHPTLDVSSEFSVDWLRMLQYRWPKMCRDGLRVWVEFGNRQREPGCTRVQYVQRVKVVATRPKRLLVVLRRRIYRRMGFMLWVLRRALP